MLVVQTLLFLLAIQISGWVNQLGHMIAQHSYKDKFGDPLVRIDRLVIGRGPSISFMLKRFLPGVYVDLCLLPFGVTQVLSSRSQREFDDLPVKDKAYIHGAGYIANLALCIVCLILYIHDLKVQMVLIGFGLLAGSWMLALLYLFRREFSWYGAPVLWAITMFVLYTWVDYGGYAGMNNSGFIGWLKEIVTLVHKPSDALLLLVLVSANYGAVSIMPIPCLTDGGEIVRLWFKRTFGVQEHLHVNLEKVEL